MVVLNRIYTRTGDDGSTALGSGKRVSKAARRVEAYGSIDETNAAIGLARALLAGAGTGSELDARLARIQNDLFDLGADLCVPEADANVGNKAAGPALRVTVTQVERLEREIDEMNARLSPLRSFVLPGGRPGAAQLHVARTVCRRAEREIVRLADAPGESVGTAALHYVNRLSDFLFVASRIANDEGRADVLWVPGQNR